MNENGGKSFGVGRSLDYGTRPGGTAPASFNANTYGTPAFWFDPDDQSTQTIVGGKLSQWNDKSGKGGTSCNLLQATAANRFTPMPRLGFRSMFADIANDAFMGTVEGSVGPFSSFTLFMVVSGLTSASDAGGLINFPNSEAGRNDYDARLLEVELTATGMKAYSAQADPLSIDVTYPTAAAWTILTIQLNATAGTAFFQKDNVAAVTDTYEGVDLLSTKMGIGTRYLSGAWGSVGVSCYYRHIVGYAEITSAGNIAAAKTALAATVNRVL